MKPLRRRISRLVARWERTGYTPLPVKCGNGTLASTATNQVLRDFVRVYRRATGWDPITVVLNLR